MYTFTCAGSSVVIAGDTETQNAELENARENR